MKITENTGIGNNDMSNPLATATTGQKTFMNTGLPLFSGFENKVADLSEETIRFGRKEIELAEHEMPGLIAARICRQATAGGARIMGSLHMTVQTAVLIETLQDRG